VTLCGPVGRIPTTGLHCVTVQNTVVFNTDHFYFIKLLKNTVYVSFILYQSAMWYEKRTWHIVWTFHHISCFGFCPRPKLFVQIHIYVSVNSQHEPETVFTLLQGEIFPVKKWSHLAVMTKYHSCYSVMALSISGSSITYFTTSCTSEIKMTTLKLGRISFIIISNLQKRYWSKYNILMWCVP